MTVRSLRQWVGFVSGLTVTSVSLSTGFIWACGSQCVTDPIVWTPERQLVLVFTAALTAWWGYLTAHYAVSGTLIDESVHPGADGSDPPGHDTKRPVEHPLVHHVGILAGVGILVLGMVVGVIYIRQGDHLMTNLGGVLFLGGYAVAHYIETGKPM